MHVNGIQTEVIHPNEWKYYNKTCPRQWAAGVQLEGKGRGGAIVGKKTIHKNKTKSEN